MISDSTLRCILDESMISFIFREASNNLVVSFTKVPSMTVLILGSRLFSSRSLSNEVVVTTKPFGTGIPTHFNYFSQVRTFSTSYGNIVFTYLIKTNDIGIIHNLSTSIFDKNISRFKRICRKLAKD